MVAVWLERLSFIPRHSFRVSCSLISGAVKEVTGSEIKLEEHRHMVFCF